MRRRAGRCRRREVRRRVFREGPCGGRRQLPRRRTAPLGESCRHIRQAGSLAFDLICDPNKQNYLTVKFWGSDAEIATIFLCVGDKRIGKYGDAWPELDLGMGGAAFPGRFYYSTYQIPKKATAGASKVRLKLVAVGALSPYASDPHKREQPLKGQSRGIYRAYSDTAPFFRPGRDEAQGKAPAAKARPKPAGFARPQGAAPTARRRGRRHDEMAAVRPRVGRGDQTRQGSGGRAGSRSSRCEAHAGADGRPVEGRRRRADDARQCR